MKKTTKIFAAVAAAATLGTAIAFAGCGGSSGSSIVIAVARGASSGTREVFEEKIVDSDGTPLNKTKQFPANVSEQESTGSAISAVANNVYALAYVSYGSVASSDKIKAVTLDGIECNPTTIKDGTYEISRPFNLVYKSYDGLADAAKDFIKYIESKQGQEIISNEYVTIDSVAESAVDYVASEVTGEISLVGSTSVQPLMEQMAEAYMKVSKVKVTVAGGGSGAGVTGAQNDTTGAVIGMASRSLSATESATLSAREIAYDGIAIIVNADVSITNVTIQQLYDLYAKGTPIDAE